MNSDETFPHDGPIYVQEQGVLRCTNYPHKVVKSFGKRPLRLTSNDVTLRTRAVHGQRKDHFINTLDSEGNIRHTAKSLLDLCLLYVGENVECIESLVGFPEQMAARLFAVAEEKKKFSEEETGCRALQVFCEAYEDLVLKSLCLRNR